MKRHLIVIGLLVATPQLAAAQFPADVQPGTRVRVWIPEAARQEQWPERRQLLRGTVQSLDAGVLRLTVPGTTGSIGIPRTSVRRLDVSRGVSRGMSMFERAAGGALSAAITVAALNNPRNPNWPQYRTDWQAAGVGAAWGAGVGALVGFFWPYERWHRVIR
ncbi:MAG TPA: hypothetical protein VK478_02250 [Gemmatimonadaceae bacterium]|nr:hypothetical protein [Gemmatimonadaceae bacterium]